MSEPEGYAPSWCAEFPNDNPALHEGVSWLCLAVGGPLRPVARARPAAGPREPGTPPEQDPAPPPVALPPAEAVLPLELDALEAVTDDAHAPLELEALEAPSLEPGGEPLELDAMLHPVWDVAVDSVFDFDTDVGDTAAPSVERAAANPVAASVAPAGPGIVSAVARVPAAERGPEATGAFAAYVAALVDVALAAGHTRAAAMLPVLVDGSSFDAATLPEEVEQRLVAANVLTRRGGKVSTSESFAAVAMAWRSVLSGATNDLGACGDSTLDGWSADLLRAFGVGLGGATDVRRELRRRGVAAFGMLQAA